MRVRAWIRLRLLGVMAGWLGVLLIATPSPGVTIAPPFDTSYTLTDLGSVPGLPPSYGGLTFLAGDRNTLLIGGNANTVSGALYTIGVSRDAAGHIDGFTGTATFHASAPYNDGGVVYGSGGVLFTSRWPVNELAQYLPGSTTPDKVIDLAAFGVASSHAALNFVPVGFEGAGQMKLVSWSGGQFYTASFAPDGLGTFDVTAVTLETTLPGGPEGFVYIPLGSSEFGSPSMLVSEYSANSIGAYEVDANGNPILATRRDFITGLAGAEGAFIDPLTGDFLFSTFGGGDRVIAVRGFAVIPEPSTLLLVSGGLLGIIASMRRTAQASSSRRNPFGRGSGA